MYSETCSSLGSELPETGTAVTQQDISAKPVSVRGRDRYLSVLRACGEISDRRQWASKRSVW
jgi:hypothetical protein